VRKLILRWLCRWVAPFQAFNVSEREHLYGDLVLEGWIDGAMFADSPVVARCRNGWALSDRAYWSWRAGWLRGCRWSRLLGLTDRYTIAYRVRRCRL